MKVNRVWVGHKLQERGPSPNDFENEQREIEASGPFLSKTSNKEKKGRQRKTMKEYETFLKTLGVGLRVLAKGMDLAAEKLDSFIQSQQDKEDKEEAWTPPVEKPKPRPRRSAPKKDEAKASAATDQMLEVLGGHPEGMDLDALCQETGFDRVKTRNVLYRLKKVGKVEAIGRGMYIRI